LRVRLALGLLLVASLARAAEVRGKVTSVTGGEPLSHVLVSVLDTKLQAVTSADGTFTIRDINSGKHTLRFEAVGYRLVTVPFSVTTGEVREFDVNLAPDNFRRTDKVEVRGDIFQGGDSPSVNEMNLTSSEIKQASTVLADDPFRAIQSLPGVSASGNNELYAEFSVMGAPFSTVGIYVDDVLIPPPLHNVPNQQEGASLSLLTSQTVDEMKLLPVAQPEKFGDEIGAALDIHTREGSRTAPIFRLAPGIADSEFLGEGELGASKHGAWLASFRKSYIGWLVRNRIGPGFNDVSFYDGDVKLDYDILPGQSLSVYSLAGHNNVQVANPASGLIHGATDFYFTRLGWRWSVSPHLLLDSRAAYIRQPVSESDVGGTQSHSTYEEWSGGTNVHWSWATNHLLEGGWTLRRLSTSFLEGIFQQNNTIVYVPQTRTGLKPDGYLQESSSFLGNRLHIEGGVRYDAETEFPAHAPSPQVSAAMQIVPGTELQVGYGRYVQYGFPPNPSLPAPFCVGGVQAWDDSSHTMVAVETRVGENMRFRIQGFDRRNEEQFHRDVSPCGVAVPALTRTVQRDYSRGVQFIAQRRSENRLSGWIGYTLVFARENAPYRNQTTGVISFSPYFSTPEDQRSSLNAFASYRLKPTISLSGKFLYGSGFPIFAGLQPGPNGTLVPTPVQRLDAYIRADLRADKSWAFSHKTLTIYGEVLNLTNHSNRIVTAYGFLPGTGFQVSTSVALPITPTAGLAFEF
jgi:carboxypeptidase-like protein